jgi:AcrR family transcriptional regulator
MREPGVKVKDRILETASRLFYDQGYNQTGINQIIEEADIARASLYHHYPSKTDLLLAYLDRTHEHWFEELDIFMRPIAGVQEKLLALFDFRIRRQLRLTYKGCHFNKIVAETCEDTQVFDRVRRHKDRLREYIYDLVRRSGHRQVLNDDALTDIIFILLEGGMALGAMYRSPEWTEKAREIVQSFL